MLIYPLGGVFVMGVFMCGINPVMGIINDFITNWLNSWAAPLPSCWALSLLL